MHISETVTQIKVMSTPVTQTLLTSPWNPFQSMLCLGNNSSAFCHCRLVCTFQSVAWMKLYSCTLFVWLLLFGIFILMFIHVAVCNSSSFFFIVGQCCTVCLYHHFFIHTPAGEYLCSFQCLSYYEQSCCEHLCSCLCTDTCFCFSWVNT